MKLSTARRLQLLHYANNVMLSRPPDLVINGSTERWRLYPKNNWRNLYIHRWVNDDVDRVLHDHEPDNLSMVLFGSFDEHFHKKPLQVIAESDGWRRYDTYAVRRTEGDVVFRLAGTPHKYTLPDGGPVVTLFFQGPRRRHWGFWCPDGWRPWEQYIDMSKGYGDRSGQGCG